MGAVNVPSPWIIGSCKHNKCRFLNNKKFFKQVGLNEHKKHYNPEKTSLKIINAMIAL